MGNYRQHVAFASTLGVGYSAVAYFVAGLHWLYGSVAILLATLGGLLPDLDSPTGIEMKGFTGLLGVLGALAIWQELGLVQPPPVFEVHLWAVVITFVLIRHGISRTMSHISVHRGISHSFPTLVVWAELTYLYYPSDSHPVRLMMGAAVGIGFFSHLLLDEICSVDLRGHRLNKAFGTAMKFWAPSIWSTLGMYAFLSALTYQVVQQWPDDPFLDRIKIEIPGWPAKWPRPKWPASWGKSPFETRDRVEPSVRPVRKDRSSSESEGSGWPAELPPTNARDGAELRGRAPAKRNPPASVRGRSAVPSGDL
jgi:membrane-bound metal-dependent hydrolase YbcI (DUF457 family)